MTLLTPYEGLTPDCILDAVESVGFVATGHLTALNSYENRVYLIGLEDHQDVVVKFYRPERWTMPQIEEELSFTLELQRADIPVIAPECPGNNSLNEHAGFYFSIFPKRSGHPLELDHLDQLEQTGRMLGRLHACGANRSS